MNKKRILTVVIVILAVAVLGIVGFILFKNFNNQASNEKYKTAASSYVKSTAGSNGSGDSGNNSGGSSGKDSTQPSTVKPKENPIEFSGLNDRNTDIYAWITVPGTLVDYPVLQSPTNDNFYLDHDLDGNYAFAGSIYSQKCNMRTFQDRVTVLYGHNMLDGSMFATLHRYEDPEFFNSNSSFSIYTDDKQLDYSVVSAFEYDDRHIMNSFNFSDDEAYEAFIDDVVNPRSVSKNVRKDVKVTTDDKLVVLSTCLDYGEGRYLVVGKLEKETPLQSALQSRL